MPQLCPFQPRPADIFPTNLTIFTMWTIMIPFQWNHLWLFNFLLFRLCFMWTMVPADSLLSTMPGFQGICAMDGGIKSRPIRSNTALSWQWMGTRWKPRAQTQHQHQLTQMTLYLLEVSQVSIVYPSNNFFSLLGSRFLKHLYFYTYIQERMLKYTCFSAFKSVLVNNTLPEISSV